MPYVNPLVVFSHLRWDFVYQRPQHVLSRIAATRPVIFIEEPVYQPDGPAGLALGHPGTNLVTVRPQLPFASRGFDDDACEALAPHIDRLLASKGLTEPVAWLYTPMALPLAQGIRPVAMVYDCMDELSLFLGAPPELIAMESKLLAAADVVFTGGISLYRAKRGRHSNIHCFPSSVDAAHFGQARAGVVTVAETADQAGLPGPRLGYFGVLDERLDLAVLDALGRAGKWQVVLVGPVVKIDPASLPRHPNIHYLGRRPYEELPSYLSGWDVCLMPFALNDATRFISPTKVLEYMAGERPIVSTPIADVAEPFGDIVYLASTPDEFVAACEAALSARRGERQDRVERMRAVLASTSWDATAAGMARLVDKAVRARIPRRAAKLAASA